MGRAKITFDYAGFNELRRSAGVTAAVRAEAEAIAERAASASGLEAGVDFVVTEWPNKTRAQFTVYAATAKAKKAEAVDGVLTRALRG